jgi:hypothetical protein
MCAIAVGQEDISTLCSKCYSQTDQVVQENTSPTVAQVRKELAENPVMGSPVGSDDGKASPYGSDDDSQVARIPPPDFSSPNDHGRRNPLSEAGTPAAQLVWGYNPGVVLIMAGDGMCFFHSVRASSTAICHLITQDQMTFFGRTSKGSKSRIIEYLLNPPEGVLDLTFDFRIGAPPPDLDSGVTDVIDVKASMSSLREVLEKDFDETPEEHAQTMRPTGYYGGVSEAMVVSLATGLVIQMGNVKKVGSQKVFMPICQIVDPRVDLATYPAAKIVQLVHNGTNHFNGWQSRGPAKSPGHDKAKASIANIFEVLDVEDPMEIEAPSFQ